MMNKSTILTILLALIAIAGQAKDVVWEQPTTEFGTSYGDGYFYLALDVTRVELKTDETVVHITARQRSDYPEYSFQFGLEIRTERMNHTTQMNCMVVILHTTKWLHTQRKNTTTEMKQTF